MPTRAELPASSIHSYGHTPIWTDDLPVCRQSGVGSSTNLLYREDGVRQEEHPCEDRSFHFHVGEAYLYAVFDGHEGHDAAQFAMQQMAFEILFGLGDKVTDEEIKDVIRQAFIAVEKSYMKPIDDRLAERARLQMDIPDDLSEFEAFKKFPHLIERLKFVNYALSCGTTAVVALVFRGKLYVANVGECRALLCRTDKDEVMRVLQLSVDHNLSNEDELLRLYQLGLDTNVLRRERRLGNQENTRCLGNYLVKGGYKEQSELANASSEPVIAEPEVHGGIPLDDSCRFLMLMSSGVCKSLESAIITIEEESSARIDQVNKELAKMAVTEFRNQSTLTGVAQAVVDKIGRMHQDVFFMSNNVSRDNELPPAGGSKGRRDDMTLLIRNFNYKLPNTLPPTFPSIHLKPFEDNQSQYSAAESSEKPETSRSNSDNCTTGTGTAPPETSDTTTTGESSSGILVSSAPPAEIQPYVDFSEYYRNVELARLEGRLPNGIDF